MVEENQGVPKDEPISIEVGDESSPSQGGIRSIGAAARGPGLNVAKSSFKRALNLTGQGATRCRLFRSRIAAAALDHMEGQINQWLDSDNIEVKHIGHVIGTMEGKTPEPNMIVLVWY